MVPTVSVRSTATFACTRLNGVYLLAINGFMFIGQRLRCPDTQVVYVYLLKQNRVNVLDEIENYPGKNIYVKTLSYRTDHLDKLCTLRLACSLGIGLIWV